MSFRPLDAVEVELLIEKKRSELHANITSGSYSQCTDPKLIGTNSQFFFREIRPVSPKNDVFALHVVHINLNIWYYIFEEEGFIFCPAFLYKLFGLTDYSCLVVKNHIHYYYIILDSKVGNPLSVVLGNLSEPQEYKFTPPSDVNKVLALNTQNKDIRYIIDQDYLYDNFSGRFCKEYGEFNKAPTSDPLNLSIHNPNYRFIRPNLKTKLATIYGELFKDFNFDESAIVHKDSATAQKVINLGKLYNEEERVILSSASKAYKRTKYKRKDYILNKLIDHIKKNYEKGKVQKVENYFCCMFTILQSSGYGKSKLMEKLGSRVPAFYSSLQQGSGYPKVSILLKMLIDKIDDVIKNKKGKYCYMNNISTAVYIYLLRIFYLILVKKKTRKENIFRSLNIDEELIGDFALFPKNPKTGTGASEQDIFNELFKDLEKLCHCTEGIAFDGEKTITLGNLKFGRPQAPSREFTVPFDLNQFIIEDATGFRLHHTNNLEKDVMRMLEEFNLEKDLPSVFIIDEAHGLLYSSIETTKTSYSWDLKDIDLRKTSESEIDISRAPYSVFRRVFRMFTNCWTRIMLITVSTCGQISVIHPELKIDPSRRPTLSGEFMDNFSLIHTYNVNSKYARIIEANMFQNPRNKISVKDWNQFLDDKRFRVIEFFKFGRPLTYGFFKNLEEQNVINGKYNLEANFLECREFKFMAMKLFAGSGEVDKDTSDFSCLYSMFNFAFGTNYLPPNISKEDLIENYMMTMVKYTIEHETKTVKDKKEVTESGYIIGGFMPEGVLNFLSARYFANHPELLTKVLLSSIKYGLYNKGIHGELLAQYFLLRAIFFQIDNELQKVRKLIFKPVTLKEFLEKLCGVAIDPNFLGSDHSLENARLSFGYFEHFPLNPIENPYNLMARCLFKGSAVTLNGRIPGIDLMIPIVLGDGRISFLGVQVKYVKEESVNTQIVKAFPKMTFSNIFEQKSDRPFAMIILVIGKFDQSTQPKVSLKRRPPNGYNPLDSPNVLVFRGVSEVIRREIALDEKQKGVMYRGIDESYLECHDLMHHLVQEYPYKTSSQQNQLEDSDTEEDSHIEDSESFETGEEENKAKLPRLSFSESNEADVNLAPGHSNA